MNRILFINSISLDAKDLTSAIPEPLTLHGVVPAAESALDARWGFAMLKVNMGGLYLQFRNRAFSGDEP